VINAGEMRHKITIKAQTVSTSAYGTGRTWSDYLANAYAKILPNTVGRDIIGPVEANKDAIRFMIRYVVGITPDMQLIHNSQTYRITHVENVRGMNVELIITAETVRL